MHSRMAPRKLSDSDKRQITSIYCQPGETTSTLANKFGISSSTVSRVLKQMLPDDEYAKLMKWKRSGERGSFPLASSAVVDQLEVEMARPLDEAADEPPSTAAETAEPQPESDNAEALVEQPLSPENEKSQENEKSLKRSRRRSTVEQTDSQAAEDSTSAQGSEHEAGSRAEGRDESKAVDGPQLPSKKVIKRSQKSEQLASTEDEEENEVAAWVSEGLEDAADFDDESDEDWDEEDWDDESDDDETEQQSLPREAELTILSFEDFSLTKSCYLVVDRTAELVTCPLKDFSELGMIPPGEEQSRTLPVFDNHKIARRFARRNQRIIKVPDGVMLNKTQGYLQAKGITRILFDGQVYALSH